MAQVNQLAATYLLDVPVHNYGGSDLAEGSAVILDTSNTGGANTAVGVTLPASDAKVIGILPSTIPAGKSGVVRVQGIANAIAGGTLHVGDVVMGNSAGKVVAQTAGLQQIGYCWSEAVNNDRVLVLIDRSKNA